MTTLEILIAARALIADPARWKEIDGVEDTEEECV